MNSNKLSAVILAGGTGSRLWPMSRTEIPKQFLCLNGSQTMLDETIERLQPLVSADDVLVVSSSRYAAGEAYQTLLNYQTLLEPVARNTAPAIALAAAWLLQQADAQMKPVMLVLPADHVIRDIKAFHQALHTAIGAAEQGKLVTFGIAPQRADTGFGYIQAATTTIAADTGWQPVAGFTEKPDLLTAQHYLAAGNYYWNSGMFVWCAQDILDAISRILPDITAVLQQIIASGQLMADFQSCVDQYFSAMPDVSIDQGVLEQVAKEPGKLVVVPCDIGWSDVGSWDAVHEISRHDANANVARGNVLAVDCNNTLLHSDHRLLAAVGIRDLCVIETDDAVLVVPREETQRVREVVKVLKDLDAPERAIHMTVRRPWGSYTVLEEREGYKMKRITVAPGAKLSLQRHQHRSEHWVVVSGTATVTRGEEIEIVSRNQSTYIPVGTLHRMENRGKLPLQIIEVQVGEYLEEDDIERFDDDYGRSPSVLSPAD